LKLVVGLGNPGPEYERSRHNVGWLIADELARALGARFALEKYKAQIAEATAGRGQDKVWIVKPQTYMNCSGESVGPVARFWKLELADVIVVHDDLELEPFRVHLKVGGGHGGHNGLKSLNAHLGGSEYVRVRVGIGRPPPVMDPADYVLGRFTRGEDRQLAECLEWAAAATKTVLEKGVAKAMNEFNRVKSAV
jgi:PTH1 family peptidyl-tRNA hydrolase